MEKFECDKSLSLKEIIEWADPQHQMHLLERIQLAMLIAAATQDPSIPTVTECLKIEQEIEFPICEDNSSLIDTEMVYYMVEDIAEEVLGRVYGEEEKE